MKPLPLYIVIGISVIFNIGLWIENQQLLDENEALREQQLTQKLSDIGSQHSEAGGRSRNMQRRRFSTHQEGRSGRSKSTEQSGKKINQTVAKLPLRMKRRLKGLARQYQWSPEQATEVHGVVLHFFQEKRALRFDRKEADITEEEATQLHAKLLQKTQTKLRRLLTKEAFEELAEIYSFGSARARPLRKIK